jgi:hypothetical protein
MRKPFRRCVRLFFAAALLAAAGEGTAAVHVEFSLAGVQKTPSFDTTYLHRYAPQGNGITLVSAICEQTVAMKAGSEVGFAFGAAIFAGGHFGVRFAADLLEAAISGSTTPDRYSMTYIGMQPPDYVAREYSASGEDALPAPEGTLSIRSYSLAAVLRLGGAKGFILDISAGPALLRFEADASSFGFRRTWLGGHSVRFQEFSQLRMFADPATRLGACLGIAAGIHLAPPAILFVEARYTLGPKTDLPVRFEIVPGTEGISPYPLELSGLAGAAPLTVDPSLLTLSAGLRISIF